MNRFVACLCAGLMGTALASGAGPVAGQAAAPDEAAQMHDFFDATLQIDVPNGAWSAKRYYEPDHTYRESGAGGDVHGTWSVEDGKICATQANAPADRPARYCNVGLGKKLGEMWKDVDPVTGNLVLFSLKPGR
jgi:hypothetical protein